MGRSAQTFVLFQKKKKNCGTISRLNTQFDTAAVLVHTKLVLMILFEINK